MLGVRDCSGRVYQLCNRVGQFSRVGSGKFELLIMSECMGIL